jgi:hypothetical protein
MKPAPSVIWLLTLGLLACGPSSTPTTTSGSETTRPLPTTAPSGENGFVLLPDFIQGVIPGARLVLLVGQSDPAAGEVIITAQAPGATSIIIDPTTISGTEVAEVTIVPGATTTEKDLSITIEARGADDTWTTTRTVTVLPWEDDREGQAREILEMFTSWLAENRPELGITPETEFTGTFLAPQLLVVSHYGFFGVQWEVGLAWHVMIPPDDFSEIYLRPRTELRPTHAFRIGSWQTALDTGDFEVVEVEPPFDVVR